ncbi:glycosyltransferase [Chryseobacterium sp. Ch-15]|uniref:Glycosyltransferase n=1 Tax=Chryseobacterium muglaense TaxID=2893752 RepID=A0A9Q3V069_9FLAO|nr:glycosyltransferase [Chryseobacterium muglaense]MBD3906464.1 glycosyltransferase [Chryseobacterium muglaense]MCC9036825.1 glycosyltransferase [Chryseobacterium muglaense]MCM2556151.1 glycosyltransferase [Chryseobacterium muglaense]
MKISIATSTFNQEKNIRDFLDAALEIADEIIIVDHFSTDRTKKYACPTRKYSLLKKN